MILDRDGTIVRDRHFLSDPRHIDFYKGVIPALKKLRDQGWKLIIGTNQSGIGRGYFTEQEMHRVHDRIEAVFRKNKLSVDEILFCPHHPEDGCHCRKPQLGMMLKAAKKHRLDLKRCWVVGDKESDILWGRKAGTRTILVLTGSGQGALKKMKVRPDRVSRSLTHAAEWIAEAESKSKQRESFHAN